MGLPLSPTEEKSSTLVRDKLYKNIILPILEGAVAEGDLHQVPKNADAVLEMAHPLRAKDGAIKPIIARFFSREIRSLVFRHKKKKPMRRRLRTARLRADTNTPCSRT